MKIVSFVIGLLMFLGSAISYIDFNYYDKEDINFQMGTVRSEMSSIKKMTCAIIKRSHYTLWEVECQ